MRITICDICGEEIPDKVITLIMEREEDATSYELDSKDYQVAKKPYVPVKEMCIFCAEEIKKDIEKKISRRRKVSN